MNGEIKPEPYKAGPGACDITPAQDGGVLKEVLKEGVGDEHPLAGDKVYVHYTGTFLDGNKFDSSRDRNQEFSFQIGIGAVIKAWDIGVKSMKKGEVAMLTCQPLYAYGEGGAAPKIPPNTTLVFEVELIRWEGEDISKSGDKSILKSKLKEGEKGPMPKEGANCDIHIVGSYEGRIFEERNVTFELGVGNTEGVITGIEEALYKMHKGEVVRLVIKSEHAFGEGKEEFSIPAKATVQYDVTLINFDMIFSMEPWEMTEEEKFTQATQYKNKGTGFFKESKFELAKNFYEKCIGVMAEYDDEEKPPVTDPTKQQELLLQARLNAAMACLKLPTIEAHEARTHCTKALHIDQRNEKALFRRGSALMHLAEYDLAIKDFEAVLGISPSNKAAKNQITIAHQKKKAVIEKEKQVFKGMFSKFAEIDAKRERTAKSRAGDKFAEIDEWENSMADDYMPIEQEVAAFGEKMPEAQYNKEGAKNGEEDVDDSGEFEKDCA